MAKRVAIIERSTQQATQECQMDRQQIIAELTRQGRSVRDRAKPSVVGVPMTVYANAPPSMRAVFESTSAFADREFLIYDDERWTYAELHLRVARARASAARPRHPERRSSRDRHAQLSRMGAGVLGVSGDRRRRGDVERVVDRRRTEVCVRGFRRARGDSRRRARANASRRTCRSCRSKSCSACATRWARPHAEPLDDALQDYLDRDRLPEVRHRSRRLLDDPVHVRHDRASRKARSRRIAITSPTSRTTFLGGAVVGAARRS